MRLARPQHVQADPPDHGGQPGSQVHDRVSVAAVQTQPGLLDRILGLGHRAEHAVGDGSQVRAPVLELVRRPPRVLGITPDHGVTRQWETRLGPWPPGKALLSSAGTADFSFTT